MWKMLDDILECNECMGPLGPPPSFMIPPPPRPPALNDYMLATASNCNEEEMASKAKQQFWDNDMCEAIPILDASLYSSQSLQTSVLIAVISLLLILIILISSLFVWKNKRKVQNLLPCKTPTRGPHITGALSHHSAVTYEDPDVHLGHHRPLVMRHHHHHHHHNVELLHGKSIHYPSGYPMTRSPPFLVSTSPGPDPYRSNDNVYEELGPSRDSDGESEPPLHSDDDFAEDELSLPGEHSFSKALSNGETINNNTSTLYHERPQINEASNQIANGCGPERHSVLSSASSNQDASTATAVSSNSSHNNSQSNCGARGGSASLLTGMLRHTTGRSRMLNHLPITERTKSERKLSLSGPTDDFSSSISTTMDANDISPLQQMYDNSSNLMAIGYPHQHNHHTHVHSHAHTNMHRHPPSYHHSLHHMHVNSNRQCVTPPTHFYNTIESEVERRNRINIQLKNTTTPAVATIFRERIQYSGTALQPSQYYYATNTGNGLLTNSIRSRTNPRSIERRRRIAPPTNIVEPAYNYTEPMYHQNYHYEACNTPQPRIPPPLVYPAYIVPDYSSGSISSNGYRHTSSGTYQNSMPVYNHGDSSFGSDSGYSHHTPASSIGRQDYDVAMIPIPPAPPAPTQKPPSKLSNALSFSWHRKKSSTSTVTTTATAATTATGITTAIAKSKTQDGDINALNSQSIPSASASISVSIAEVQTEASSPNNNSGSGSSLTNGLENTNTTSINTSSSSCSSAGNTQHLNNHNNNNSNSNNSNNNSNSNSISNHNSGKSNNNSGNNSNNNSIQHQQKRVQA